MQRLLAVGMVLAGLAAGSLTTLGVATPAHAQESGRLSSTWLPYWNAGVAYERITANADLFHTTSPFWFRATSCTGVDHMPGAGDTAIVDGLRGNGIRVVPSITSTMLPAEATACLGDPERRTQHVNRVLALVRSGAYDGLEFNYESLALTTDAGVASAVRNAYTDFARQVCDALRAEGKTCVHTVMPRTDDTSSVWRGKLIPAVYDYRALGEVADRVRVMGYDQYAGGTGPGPIAGWPWLSAVADYTQATVPPDKAELGIPLYGRDWSSRGTTTLNEPQAQALARQYGVPVRWDDGQRSPTFTYSEGGVRHTVWFSDSRSVAERVALARSRGFGAAYWVPGQEDPALWGDVRATSNARFWDVVGGELQRSVEAVAGRGIALGLGDGSFRPLAPVTRGQMASFLARALSLPPATAPAPYSDTAGSAHAAAIDAVAEAGVAGGFPDGTFRPHEAVSRGQMASFLQRGLALDACLPAPFADVAASPHEAAICAVAARGIAQGRPDGGFAPAEPVTRGQMARFLARALGI